MSRQHQQNKRKRNSSQVPILGQTSATEELFGEIKVAIGYITGTEHSAFFTRSLVGELQNLGSVCSDVISIISGPKIDTARNQLFKEWLDTDADYLLMVDSDMSFPVGSTARLFSHQKPIVGGLCFSGRPDKDVRPTLHIAKEVEGGVSLDILWDYPPDEVIQVAATGGAFMLIDRNVAERIWEARGFDHPMPWFAHGLHNGVEIGEDIAFCITAGVVGFETWVDTGLKIGHMKTINMNEEQYVRSLNREAHPYYDDRESVPIYKDWS